MNIAPVIHRELVSQSRQAGTYWLRVLGALGMLGVFMVSAMGPFASGRELGARLFDSLNLLTYYLILVFVPLLTADSISREKRDGTLGLLFLTPLRPRDIVLGKSLSQALRGATLLLAMLPMLLLPSLLGGVGGVKAVMTVVVQGCVFLLALVAGIVISSIARSPIRGALGAIGLTIVAVIPLNLVLGSICGLELWAPLFLPQSWLKDTGASSFRMMPVFSAGWRLEIWLAILLSATTLATLGGLWQATRQVALFWQEADQSTATVRRTVGTWARGLAGVALATQLVLLVMNPGGVLGWSQADVRGVFLPVLFFVPLILLVPLFTVNGLMARFGSTLAASPATIAADDRRQAARRDWRFLLIWILCAGGLAALPVLFSLKPGRLPSEVATVLLATLPLFLANSVAIVAAGIAAGALAVAWRRHWSTALAWGLVGSIGLAAGLVAAGGYLAVGRVENLLEASNLATGNPGSQVPPFLLGIAQVITSDPLLVVDQAIPGQVSASLGPRVVAIVLQNGLLLAFIAVLLAVAGRWLAGRRWAGKQASNTTTGDEQRALVRDFCEPFIGHGWFRRRNRRLLDVNPIRWLHERAWSARLTGLGWCLGLLIAEIPVIVDLRNLGNVFYHQVLLMVCLQTGLAFAAAGTFQREKANGVLELLLVTPITAAQVIRGRWAALTQQFLLAFGIVLFITAYAGRVWSVNQFPWERLLPVVCAVLPAISLPLIGLYWSLRLRSMVMAWLVSVAYAFIASVIGLLSTVPLLKLAENALRGSLLQIGDEVAFGIVATIGILVQATVARRFWQLLVTGLANRRLVLP